MNPLAGFDPAQLQFLRPQWLWLLAALPVLAWWWRSRQRAQTPWRDAVDAHLLPHLLEGGGDGRVPRWPWAGLLGAALAILALAGPSWRQSEQPLWQTRAPLVIALDLSSAVLANDLQPSRLLQARAKIARVLEARAGGQVGLLAYADDAYVVSPLTDDPANVRIFLDALSPDIMPVDGSRADRAIDWAMRLLRQAGFDRGDILLLTDHADGAARSAATDAMRSGYRVSAIGLGTAAGASVLQRDGGIARAGLDAGSLRVLASAGGGAYAPLAPGDADLRALGVLDPAEAEATATRGQKTRHALDDGYWLLLPLMLLALLAFRRGGALAVLALGLLLPTAMQPASAQQVSNPATPTFASGLWRRPDQQAHARMREGAQAYRRGDYDAAARAYSGIDTADAQYNLGNALAKAGRYDEAIAAYDRALRQRPKMDDAIANRKAVEAAKKRQQQQPQGDKPGNQRPDKNGKNQRSQQKPCKPGDPNCYQQSPNPMGSQTGDSQQPPRDGQQPRPDRTPQSTQPASPESPGQPAQPQPPKDPQAQRAADAEQKRRMEEALRRQPSPKPGISTTQARAETPQQRERRLANEAWLRRVPDDPGSLLRNKFRLEQQRRQQGGD